MRYLYRPYHSWRHGFLREKIGRWMVRILWFLMLTLSLHLLAGNVHIQVKEQILKTENGEENVVGIGIDTDSGEIFWFERHTENVPGR